MNLKPLPEFEKVTFDKLPLMSIICEAGSNKITQWAENHWFDFPYTPVFTHAFVHIAEGKCINVGFNTTIEPIEKLYHKSHRYIVISYKDMTLPMIQRGIEISYDYAKKLKYRLYDYKGYLGFLATKLPFLKQYGIFHGSKKDMFCSDLCVHIFQDIPYQPYVGVDSEKKSPCGLFTFSSTISAAWFQELIGRAI